MSQEQFIGICVFIFGSIIGSFLNVCIVRLPLEKSVVAPGSHCIRCKNPIAWHDNIPLISYVLLLGKCRYCSEKFSIRYFFVELLTALSFYAFYLYYGLTPVYMCYMVMVCGFIVATFVDFEHRIIPDEVSVGGMVVGIILSFFVPALHKIPVTESSGLWPNIHSVGQSLLGVLIGGGSIYAMGMLGDLIFRKESMGGGDVKLLAMAGAFMGWQLALLTFFIAPFFGAFYGIIEKIRTKESAIAYGPFLVGGALVSLFFGDRIIYWILSGYGL